MNRANRMWVIFAVIMLSPVCGCSVDYYRAETRLHPDGQIDRAIYQPTNATPEKARHSEFWKETRRAKKIEQGAWTGKISELSAWTGDESQEYFAAWNRFATVDQIPDYFVVESADAQRQGRLVRQTRKIDLVFVTEHRWHETLNDVVTLNDMHIANRELADLYTSYVDDVLTAGLGDEYNHKPLIAWMNGEGKQWFVELTNAYYEAGVLQLFDNGKKNDKRVRQRFADICERHKLKGLEQDDIREYAAAKLRRLVRRTDGKPLDDETTDSILVWMSLKEAKTKHGESKPSPLEEVAKDVVATKYGGKDEFSGKMFALASRIWGLYGPFSQARHFNYSLQMPGTIVESSGELHANNLTQWTFKASAAYPRGYHMTCRSLEPNAEVIRKLLNHQPLDSRQTLLLYAELVGDNERLLRALRQSVQLQNLTPLQKHRARAEARNKPESEDVVSVLRLWKLLKLPD